VFCDHGSRGQAYPGIDTPYWLPNEKTIPPGLFGLEGEFSGNSGIALGQYETEFHLKPPSMMYI
jgi:hypothetical protein